MFSTMINTRQGQLAAYENGRGPPILFLHADSGRASQWFEIAERLGPDHRVVCFDFHGSGDSSPARNEGLHV